MSLFVDIQKRFANFELDLRFEAASETLGLLGASGCGKSLSLRCIAGLEKPDTGRIEVAGTTFFDSKRGINLSPQERKTALLFQNYMLFPNLTVEQNIAAGISHKISVAKRHELVAKQLMRFKLTDFAKRYPLRLSGGQQQRVAIARMLAAEPKILMLDEPFSALDSHLKSFIECDLIDLFDEFKGTVVYVSHDIDEAFRFCDRIAIIDAGKLAELSTKDAILNHPQSHATLKVSGAKNISVARKISTHSVRAIDWGIVLETDEEVPDDIAYLAIRASFIEVLTEAPNSSKAQSCVPQSHVVQGALKANCYMSTIERIIDSRFERNVIFRPIDESKATMSWRYNMVDLDPGVVLKPGAQICVHIPKDKIHMVSR